jgi:hypothetical protein
MRLPNMASKCDPPQQRGLAICVALLGICIAVAGAWPAQQIKTSSIDASSISAHKLPTDPALTDVEKLTVLTAVQRLEIAQLRAKDAERELRGLLKSLEKPGFTFNIQTLSYQQAPESGAKKAP